MTVSFFLLLIGVWILYAGWRFYKQVNWDEPPVSTPDMGLLHKREAELLHIQDVLEEAHTKGSLSAEFIKEYRQYCEKELAQIHTTLNNKR